MAEYKGLSYLQRKLNTKRTRVNLRYKYYEMKTVARDLYISTPRGLENWFSALGWCARAVDVLADRIVFRQFDEDNFNMNNIYNQNNPDIIFDSAVLSALIAGCSFIYISTDADGQPRLQVIDGGNATGEIDPITGLLTEGYAVLERDDNDIPILEAYFTAGETTYYQKGLDPYTYTYAVDYPLLVPIIYRPDARRPFGHSRISRDCMDIQQAAARTIKRGEISAEFYSFPQKYATGVSNDIEALNAWNTAMSSFLMFSKDGDGDSPTLGQFNQQSMAPHTDQLEMFASLFAGATGLTKDDLGFVSDNPSSQEAIKASHENLRLTARKAQRSFGTGFLNAGYLAACVRDSYPYSRSQIYETKCKWEPIFEPDAATLSSIGDGVIKINQAVPGYIGNDNLRDLTGIKSDED